MNWRVYWSIGWRTFSALAAASLLALMSGDVLTSFTVQPDVVVLALFTSFVGALVAVAWAFVRSPATTALQKAVRSAVEKGIAVLIAIPINSVQDIVSFPRLLLAGASVVILSFLITFFNNQGSPPPTPTIVSSQG